MSDYTPTTPMIRTGYMRDGRERKQRAAEFDRWLAAHDAELREQIAADVAHAIDTHVMTWDETTAPHVRKGWRIARSIALDTITNPKEQP